MTKQECKQSLRSIIELSSICGQFEFARILAKFTEFEKKLKIDSFLKNFRKLKAQNLKNPDRNRLYSIGQRGNCLQIEIQHN